MGGGRRSEGLLRDTRFKREPRASACVKRTSKGQQKKLIFFSMKNFVILFLLIDLLLMLVFTSCDSRNDSPCFLTDSLIVGFKFKMTKNEFNNHVNQLRKEGIIDNQNRVKINSNEDIVYFIIYPTFHVDSGLCGLKLVSQHTDAGMYLWKLLCKKYGERKISENKGELVLDRPQINREFNTVNVQLHCHSQTDMYWQCNRKNLTVSCLENIVEYPDWWKYVKEGSSVDDIGSIVNDNINSLFREVKNRYEESERLPTGVFTITYSIPELLSQAEKEDYVIQKQIEEHQIKAREDLHQKTINEQLKQF